MFCGGSDGLRGVVCVSGAATATAGRVAGRVFARRRVVTRSKRQTVGASGGPSPCAAGLLEGEGDGEDGVEGLAEGGDVLIPALGAWGREGGTKGAK